MSSNILSFRDGIASLPSGLNSIDVAARRGFRFIEACLPSGYISNTITSPPANPQENDKYIVPSGATGIWAGHTNEIAYYDLTNEIWEFYKPHINQAAIIAGRVWFWDDTVWSSLGDVSAGVTIQEVLDAIDNALQDYLTEAEINALLGDYATKTYVNDLVTTSLAAYLPLSGGQMTGNLYLNGEPTTNNMAATKKYVDDSVPDLTPYALKTELTDFVTGTELDGKLQDYLTENDIADFVKKTGDTMTGYLNLNLSPTSNLHAVNKAYADQKLALSGGTMTGNLVLDHDPVSGKEAATKDYVDNIAGDLNGFVQRVGDTMTGPLISAGDPTTNLEFANKRYVDSKIIDTSSLVQKAGDTMTGLLTLSGPPTANLHAATKQYVDSAVAGVTVDTSGLVKKAGDTMTGPLFLSGNATAALHAVPKQQLDLMMPLTGGVFSGPVSLYADPTTSTQAATKNYVDNAINNIGTLPYLPLAGGTMSGSILLDYSSDLTSFQNQTPFIRAITGTSNSVDQDMIAIGGGNNRVSVFSLRSGSPITEQLGLNAGQSNTVIAYNGRVIDGKLSNHVTSYCPMIGFNRSGITVFGTGNSNVNGESIESASINFYIGRTLNRSYRALQLDVEPTANNHAATKRYVDEKVASVEVDLSAYALKTDLASYATNASLANYLQLSGGTMSDNSSIMFPTTQRNSATAMLRAYTATGNEADTACIEAGAGNERVNILSVRPSSPISTGMQLNSTQSCGVIAYNARVPAAGRAINHAAGYASFIGFNRNGYTVFGTGTDNVSGQEIESVKQNFFISRTFCRCHGYLQLDVEGTQPDHVVTKNYVDNIVDASALFNTSNCTATGSNSSCMSAGSCQVSGTRSVCIASVNSTASSTDSFVLGCQECDADQSRSGMIGSYQSNASMTGGILLSSARTQLPLANSWGSGYANSGDQSSANLKFSCDFNGNVRAAGTITPSATFTDYAEFFENESEGIIPVGTIVTLSGRYVRPAKDNDIILGVISGTYKYDDDTKTTGYFSSTSSIVCGDSPFTWSKRYLTDEFGSIIYELVPDADWKPTKIITEKVKKTIVEVVEKTDDDGFPIYDEETGKPIMEEVEREIEETIEKEVPNGKQPMLRLPKENPDFDITKENKPRSERPEEWSCVGLIGQLHVRVDESVKSGSFVKPKDKGIGTIDNDKNSLLCMQIKQAYDEKKGYAIALCLLK